MSEKFANKNRKFINVRAYLYAPFLFCSPFFFLKKVRLGEQSYWFFASEETTIKRKNKFSTY